MWVPVICRRTKDASSRPSQSERSLNSVTDVPPAAVKVALSAVVWFLAVTWLDFSGGPEVGLVLTVVTSFFIMLLTLLLLAASMATEIRSGKQPERMEAAVTLAAGLLQGKERTSNEMDTVLFLGGSSGGR